MNTPQPTILIFGAGINQLTLIRAARGLGLQSVVLDVSENVPGKELADYFYCVAGDDYEATRQIAARHAVSGIVTSQMEKPMRLMARLAAGMGFIFHAPEVTERSLDKWLMKQAFLQAGVPCASGMLIQPGEAPTAEGITRRGLRFPVILKPRDATSSQGVFKVDSVEEIGKYLPVSRSFSRAGQAIIEEFLEGPEYSVESITYRGQTTVVQITEKFVTPFPHTVEMGHLQPAELPAETEESIRKAVVKAIEAIGIDNSAAHAEVKLTESGPRLVEIGARLGGDFIASYLASTSCGVDMDRAAIQVALGQPPDLEKKWNKYSCIKYAQLPAGEQVIDLGPWQELLEKPDVIFAHVNINPGDTVPAITQSKDRPGFVIVEGESRQAALAAAADCVSRLEGCISTGKPEFAGRRPAPQKMKTYRVLYFGTWGYGRAGLEALLALRQVDVVKVFSKWNLASANPYLNHVYQLATGNGLALVDTEKRRMPKEAFWKAILEAGEVDFILSCCYDRFFPGHILALPGMGALNMHPSLLPKYRGIKPLENALANGETTIGVTLHELARELDAGDAILQKAADISREDTFGQAYDLQCELIKSCLAEFFADPEALMANKKPQDHSRRSDAPRLPFDISERDTVRAIAQKMKRI